MRAETNASSTVSIAADPMPNHKLAVRSIDLAGSTRWMDSLVISVSTASSGVISTFTPKLAGHAGESRGHAGQRMAPTLLNATAPSGISTR